MRIRHRNCGSLLIALPALGFVIVAISARADEPLRWKFKVGEKLDYNMVQEMAVTAVVVPGKKSKDPNISWNQYVKDSENAKIFSEKYKDKDINWMGRVASVSEKPAGKGSAVVVNMDPLDTKSSASNITINAAETLKAKVAALKKGDTVSFVGRIVKQGTADSNHEVDATEISAMQAQNTTMRQEMNMTWDVLGVDDKSGEAVVRQKFARVKMKMAMPLGGFEYDSASEEVPAGPAAMVAPMYKAMTESEFEITMTSRGEVKDVKIPEQVITALKNSPNAAAMGDIVSPEGFKKMISQGALVLPKDPPKKGDSWTTKVEMKNPNVGKQTVETTYRYEGTKDIAGTVFAVIRPQLKMEFGEQPAAPPAGQPQQPPEQQQQQMKIKEQTSEGQVLFNILGGRLQSTTLRQNVMIDASVGGVPVLQKIDQQIDVTVSLSGEKKSDAAKPVSSGEKAK